MTCGKYYRSMIFFYYATIHRSAWSGFDPGVRVEVGSVVADCPFSWCLSFWPDLLVQGVLRQLASHEVSASSTDKVQGRHVLTTWLLHSYAGQSAACGQSMYSLHSQYCLWIGLSDRVGSPCLAYPLVCKLSAKICSLPLFSTSQTSCWISLPQGARNDPVGWCHVI